ncbi:hypothetical protein [Weissella hellenica]|nr:hypothetical protein [Weissella hellenica]
MMAALNRKHAEFSDNEALAEQEKLNREFKRATRSLPRQEVTQADLAAMIKHNEW